MFAYLEYDSDDNKSKKDDFPKISVSIIKKEVKAPMSYVNIIVKTKEQVIKEEEERVNRIYNLKLCNENKKDVKYNSLPIKRSFMKMDSKISWADVESSDEEDSLYNDDMNEVYDSVQIKLEQIKLEQIDKIRIDR